MVDAPRASYMLPLTAEGRGDGDRLLPSAHGFRSIIALWGSLIFQDSYQRETHIPLQSSPSRVGRNCRKGHPHTMPPWHWILEGPPQGCLTFCSAPPPATHAGAVEAILGWIALVVQGSSTHDMPAKTFDDAGPAAGPFFLPAAGGLRLCSDLP